MFDELAAADELLVLLTPTSIRRPWIFAEIGAMMALQNRIVAINYGVDEDVLDQLGIKTLLGTHLTGTLNDVDRYFDELSQRIAGSSDGQGIPVIRVE